MKILSVITIIWATFTLFLTFLYITDIIKKQFFKNEVAIKVILGIACIIGWILIFLINDYFT